VREKETRLTAKKSFAQKQRERERERERERTGEYRELAMKKLWTIQKKLIGDL
jgi:hypothetical protein